MDGHPPDSPSFIPLRLGTITLPNHLSHRIPDDSWFPVQDDFSRATSKSYQEIVNSLKYLLSDDGVGLVLSGRVSVNSFVIRVSINPRDSPSSSWDTIRVRSGERKKNLGILFEWLEKGWDGDGPEFLSTDVETNDNLDVLYAKVQSPPEHCASPIGDESLREVYEQLEAPSSVRDIGSTLKRFQVRSIARMIRMEVSPDSVLDPLMTALVEADNGRPGRTFFLNQKSWDVTSNAEYRLLPKGGILCEEMGSGKTIICLALIVLTLRQPCKPPTNRSVTPISTTYGLDHVPFEVNYTASISPESTYKPRLPSLAQLAANVVIKELSPAWKHFDLTGRPAELLREPTFYYNLPGDARDAKRSAVVAEPAHPVKIFLAHTTLVVVPQLILSQWVAEIAKHVKPVVLEVLVIQDGTAALPDIEVIIRNDLVIIDVNRMSKDDALFRALFRHVRWKRLIVDEGSIASKNHTRFVRLISELDFERKWLVSGTPTPNLQQGVEYDNSTLAKPLKTIPTIPGPSTAKKSKKADTERRSLANRFRVDAKAFGNMLCNFLDAILFPEHESNFAKAIVNVVFRPGGPELGSIARVQDLLSRILVKHRPGEIKEESPIPPITIQVERLVFDPVQLISYNVLVAIVKSNLLIFSKLRRKSLLNKKNRAMLEAVVQGFHQSCFWHIPALQLIVDCLPYAHNFLAVSQPNLPAGNEDGREALNGVMESISYLEDAQNALVWNHLRTRGDTYVPFRISSMAKNDYNSFGMGASSGDFFDPKDIEDLRKLNRSIINAASEPFRGDKGATKRKPRQPAASDVREKIKNDSCPAVASLSKTQKQSEKASTAHESDDVTNGWGLEKSVPLAPTPKVPGLSTPLPSEVNASCGSSKLDFFLRTIQSSQESDKFVIFGGKEELKAAERALEMLGIPMCHVRHGLPRKIRDAQLETFRQPIARLLLLDLKVASKGLDLTMANRMIFLKPVWNRDILSQAIKRIHRIGQTKPTLVQILTIKDTFEEDIADRHVAFGEDAEPESYRKAMIQNVSYISESAISDSQIPITFEPSPLKQHVKKRRSDEGTNQLSRKKRKAVDTEIPRATKRKKAVLLEDD